MNKELEAVIWCPRCQVEKYRVWRVPGGNEGVYKHEIDPADALSKTCDCGANLERSSRGIKSP